MDEDDLPEWEYKVKITFQKEDITERFDTFEKAQAFERDQMKNRKVVKSAINKVAPDEEEKAAVDGGSDSDDGL